MPRTFLITGSASGIGAATSDYLRDQGIRVIGADLRGADITVDLATEAGRGELVERAREISDGRLDGVIACAGIALFDPLTIQVNYFGAVATLAGLRPLLAEGTDPRAVVISSVASLHPTDTETVDAALAGDEQAAVTAARAAIERGDGAQIYASSKAAIARWVRRTAITPDWAGAGIALNAIAPGTIVTPMIQPMLDTEEGRRAIDGAVPMPLHGHARPEQIAPLLGFLTSPANSHITGQVVFVDGGADAVLRGEQTW
ncbi:SDR family oxidoreductase [Nocardia cyriacigeorgica]|jgi:NAD(P)-dependent dehydrogenase (short-subunit alcohol dehydrogenase family)|uniref:SDR family oxidoreductase n=1 Tax=Nocardia cyriacigeorgica TaxID=135487 RepID=UPI000CE9E26C|nr:SDR family oxidoreductase [Nocardia cyriacigeorgica]AVH22624.1 short-chain dehydrogenase [Nocardia cyriacigeorgica]MBF6086861.1 SDR family oxidoreductase [Nocardia cyriacigeorgica]MBF6090815.1 SDR family oxidoreductase [Nocardia cyriacigeorgica]MBF6322294.1 SDR family oxidoreductase [Nocardia cyriacigeorgica]PPJ14586.1 short-chain dehydrogenase [Nocardia cyriacigeorgica]